MRYSKAIVLAVMTSAFFGFQSTGFSAVSGSGGQSEACRTCMAECPHVTRDLKPCDRGCPEVCAARPAFSSGFKDEAANREIARLSEELRKAKAALNQCNKDTSSWYRKNSAVRGSGVGASANSAK